MTRRKGNALKGNALGVWPQLDIYKVMMAFSGERVNQWIFTEEEEFIVCSCPFCGARKAGKFRGRKVVMWPFVMDTHKEAYLCYACDRRGDGYAFIVEAEDCTQKEAFELGRPYRIVRDEE